MKKLIALILIAFIILMLAACSHSSTNGNNNVDSNEGSGENSGANSGENSGENSDENSGGNNNDTDKKDDKTESSKNKIDTSKITSSTQFSEGKAWVRCGKVGSEENLILYCIDKEGNILFTLETTVLNDPLPFSNGLSVLLMMIDGKTVSCLCDETGNVIKPSDVGATEFLIRPSMTSEHHAYGLFKDGYIFAKKTEATFSGSTVTAAVLNSSLEIVAGYSEDIFALYEKHIKNYYYNGYFYNGEDEKVFDVKAGKEIEFSTFVSRVDPQNTSELWRYNTNSGIYYNPFDPEESKTVDLSQYSETIARMFPFENGHAPIVFESADKAFFTVINEDGSFCFDPVELSVHKNSAIFSYNGKYIVALSMSQKCIFETFDINGKITEGEVYLGEYVQNMRFSDDVINLYYYSSGKVIYKYYTFELEPLF